MRPYQKDSFLNEASNHNQNHNPRFYNGGSYHHYFDKPPIQNDTLDRDYSQFGNPEIRQGTHAGKGPKSYRRSDASIQEEVCEEMTLHPELDATHIEVKVSKSIVTLTGTVSSRAMKRLAETCIDHVSGVLDVFNHVQVEPVV